MRRAKRGRRGWILVPVLALAGFTGTAKGAIPEDPHLWEAGYNGPGNFSDFAHSVAVSPDGTKIFVAGYDTGSGSSFDYATLAYDAATGSQLWVARYNGPANDIDFVTALAVSPDGSKVFVAGTSTSSEGWYDYATLAYDAATGSQLWVARYNGPANRLDHARSLAVSPDGSKVFVTGSSYDSAGYDDYATVAYDATGGSQLWSVRYNAPANSSDIARSLAVSPDGSKVFVTGTSYGLGSSSDYATVAYDAGGGSQSWVTRYNGPGNSTDDAFSLGVSPDGSTVFVAGSSRGSTIGSGYSSDYATIAYSAGSGSQSWVTRYNGPSSLNDAARSLAVSPDGSKVFVTGYSESSGSSYHDYATVAYAAVGGSQLWSARYNGPGNSSDDGRSLAVSPDGSKVFVTGSSFSSASSFDYATVAYRTTTCASGADETGPISTTVHYAVEPEAGAVESYAHGVNCDVVVANGL